MKRYILSVVFAAFVSCSAAIAQEAPAPKTKLEAFSAQSGAVMVRGFSEVGQVYGIGRVIVTAREFVDATTQRKQYGVSVEVKEVGRLERSGTSYIDEDEIASLLKGIDYIVHTDNKVTRLKNFEATYVTKGEFRITIFNDDKGKISAVVASRGASAFVELPQLANVREHIVKANQVIQDAKK